MAWALITATGRCQTFVPDDPTMMVFEERRPVLVSAYSMPPPAVHLHDVMEILGLDAQSVRQRRFAAAADHVAGFRSVKLCRFRHAIGGREHEIRVQMRDGETTGEKEQRAVAGDEPGARPRREQPIGGGIGGDDELPASTRIANGAAARRPVEMERLEIGLDTEQEGAVLPVVAGFDAGGEAIGLGAVGARGIDGADNSGVGEDIAGVHGRRRRCPERAPRATGGDPDISAGPA